MTTELENQIKEFRNYLIQLGYSKGSCRMLPDCVRDFIEYTNITDLKGIQPLDIVRFYEHLHIRPHKLKAGGLSDQYISHHVYGLKVFFEWLEKTGQVKGNPMSLLHFKRATPNTREPLSRKEITSLFNASTTLQETAILHLFYSCGLRRNEGERLNTADIHFKKQLLYVRSGKGAKRRVIPMPESVAKALEEYYLKERTSQKQAKDIEAFMVSSIGTRMSGEVYNKILKQLQQRAHQNGNPVSACSLHHLRHSIATHLLESGLSIEQVRDFLGHGHLDTTQVYAKVNLRNHRL
jgi:integrase/recombinase XerD